MRSWTPAGALFALDVLGTRDVGLASRLADDFWRLDEVRHATWSDEAVLDRRNRAYAVMLRGFHSWSLEEVVDALALGRLHIDFQFDWEHERRQVLFDHPALATPEQRLAALKASVEAGGWDGNPGWTTWLLHRLTEDPVPDAGAWLAAAWQEHRSETREHSLAEAVLATGDVASIQGIADTIDDRKPSFQVMKALICVDPATAASRLKGWLSPFPTEQPKLSQALALLKALAADGFSAGGLGSSKSQRAMGWVRQDPGWVSLLLECRKHKDPNVSHPARSALAHADPALVESLTPKKASKGRKIPEATLKPLGSVKLARRGYWGTPIAWSEDAIAFFAAPARVEVRKLSTGLPASFSVDLPDGLSLPSTPRDPNDDGWGRPGVHGIALDASAGRLAIAGNAGDTAGVWVFSAGGEVKRWSIEDHLPHRLHFSPTGALWVLCEGDAPTVFALDPTSLEAQGSFALTPFPPPAFVEAFPHDTDDVGVFQIACGQDGLWLKVVERGPKKLKIRSQKLSSVHHDSLLYAFALGGSVAVTLLQSKLLLREWPTLKPLKGKLVDGSTREAAASGDLVLVSVARVLNQADAFEVFKAPKWDRVAVGQWPKAHNLLTLQGDKLITTLKKEVHVWQLRL
ncbi:MAG: hypothetical protein H6718_19845 [Polyangiaceae bacterium]|nr:hypothetical protein [Polyangiaceae bacterium]MCB9605536.1 hypothetical protein [Polyangiaceae bacterium]